MDHVIDFLAQVGKAFVVVLAGLILGAAIYTMFLGLYGVFGS